MAHFKFKIKKAEKKFKVQNKKFDIQRLKNKEKREEFKLELKNRFEILQESPDTEIDIEKKWREIKDIFLETSKKRSVLKINLKRTGCQKKLGKQLKRGKTSKRS
jgi:hypothetical protein